MRLFATLRQQYLKGRFSPLLLLALLYLTASGITRLVLFFMDLHLIEAPLQAFFAIMAIGLFFDVVAAAYLLAPFALYLFALPQRLFLSRAHRLFIFAMMLLTVFGAIYLEAAEYFFFDEFNSRFNFVAVEYLIYPHEVFVNIWESYPVGRVLLAAAVLALAAIWGARRPLRASLQSDSRLSQRLQPLLLQLALAGGAYAAVDINSGYYSSNHVANELAQNGAYSFFYAALNNEMDYRQHYRTIAPAEAAQRLRRLVQEPDAEFIPNAADPIARHIAHHGEPKRLNVVVIVEESLGAEFVGAYGDTRGLTPNFDRLGLLDFSYDSLFFGRDIFAGSPDDKFVLLPHNRDVALYRDGHLSELGIKRFAAGYRYDAAGARLEKAVEDVEGIRDAVSIYQSGYDLFKNGQYRL